MDAASRLNVDGNTKNYVFVNALGLGARNLGGGERCFRQEPRRCMLKARLPMLL